MPSTPRPERLEVEVPSDIERNPLVFLSATRADEEWRARLRKSLDRYTDDFEWWDDSKINAGEKWQQQIDAAIQRARVAVVFLSRAYLESETTTSELLHLGELQVAGRLTLFPILLEQCEWRQYRFLREVQIWNKATPIGELSAEAVERELENIAADIRKLFEKDLTSAADGSRDLEFSVRANAVLARAWSLAELSKRGRVTSSCLLFALADPGPTSNPQFLRDVLNENGRYIQEFERFMIDGEPYGGTFPSLPGIQWRMTENAAATIEYAVRIAIRVTKSSVVHTRHLIAALITPEIKGSDSVRERLKRLGVEQKTLCVELRKRVRSTARNDNPDQWDAILGISEPPPPPPDPDKPPVEPDGQQPDSETDLRSYRPYYSSYLTDSVAYGKRDGEPLDDALNVGMYAGHLAQLIAAKDTPMPLAIGLFGAWGAGKSYFMDLLDDQLTKIAATPWDKFYKHITPIKFNAWHYLDTNLWANLVSEIFDQLFNSLSSTEDEEKKKLQNLKTKLAQQSALAEEAKAAVDQAQRVRQQAETDLRAAMQERAKQENNVTSLLNDLPSLLRATLTAEQREQLQKQLDELAADLGLPKLASSFTELQTRAAEVHSLGGRTKALVLAVFTGKGWWKRAILLMVALAVPLAAPLFVSWLAANGAPWIKDLLAGAGRTIIQIVTAIGALSTWLAAQVKAGNSVVNKLESAYDEVVKVRTQREAMDDAAIAQAALAARKQEEDEARHKLHEAEEKLKTIKTELADMAPGRQLIRFLRQRATAEDYRRHLGLVSLVRRDFKQLSDLLTGAAKDTKNLPEIDRVVLYIDDLDRCRSDKVIEVLEAVQLLLAFPLFAVVVAVDPRWLRQSLLDHYPRLLGAEEERANPRTILGRAATPQDYLEKIFQVPFNLQPMDEPGFNSLVNRFFSVNGSGSNGSGGSDDESEETGKETQPPITDPVDEPQPDGTQTTTQKTEPDVPPPPVTQDVPPKDEKPPPPPPDHDTKLDPTRLVLTEDEIKDVKRFYVLFQTPRAVKRLANTYSLIRVGVDEKEWSNYLGFNGSPPAYRVPLLLLAVASAFPSLARPWLLWLRRTPPPVQWQLAATDVATLVKDNSDTTERIDWEKLQECLEEVDLKDWPPPDPKALETWVPRVARYSF